MNTVNTNYDAKVQPYGDPDVNNTGEFSDMSLEDIMFAVFTGKASAQTEEIKKFAATIKHNTLRATNFSNLKAALDSASENLSKGTDTTTVGDVTVNWQDEYGNHETISAGEAFERLGFSSDKATVFTNVADKQRIVDQDKQAVLDTCEPYAEHFGVTPDHRTGYGQWVRDSYMIATGEQNTPYGDVAQQYGQNYADNVARNPAPYADIIGTYDQDPDPLCHQLRQVTMDFVADNADLDDAKKATISKADIEQLATEIDNQHSSLEGQQQIDMAKLNKMFTDVQTSWNLVNSGIKTFGNLGKTTAQSLSQ